MIVGIGAIALNMLPVSSDTFKVDSLCKYFIFFYAGFLIQIYFEIFPEWKKILDNTGVLIIGCLAWGMVFVQGYFYSATVCQCYWNFCLRSVCYKNL